MVRPVQTVTSYRTTDGEIWHSEDEAKDHQFRLDEDELEEIFQILTNTIKEARPTLGIQQSQFIAKDILLNKSIWDFFSSPRFNRDDMYFFLDCKGFDI